MTRHSIDKGYLYGLYFAAIVFMIVGVLSDNAIAFYYGFGVGAATGFVHIVGDRE